MESCGDLLLALFMACVEKMLLIYKVNCNRLINEWKMWCYDISGAVKNLRIELTCDLCDFCDLNTLANVQTKTEKKN